MRSGDEHPIIIRVVAIMFVELSEISRRERAAIGRSKDSSRAKVLVSGQCIDACSIMHEC